MLRHCKTFLNENFHARGVARRFSSCATWLFALAGAVGCGTAGPNPDTPVTPPSLDLRLNEVMTENDGAWIDEAGETDDWLEVVNTGTIPVRLGDFFLEDAAGARVRLRGPDLEGGGRRILWADGDETEGPSHLPFKLSSSGDQLRLTSAEGESIDQLELPVLALNQVLARFPDGSGDWATCRYASPRADNGGACAPPAPPSLIDDVEFQGYSFPADFPAAPSTLSLSELAFRPEAGAGAYLELFNGGAAAVSLADYELSIAPHAPHLPWPSAAEGSSVALPALSLTPGERVTVNVPEAALADLETDPSFEGVSGLFERSTGTNVDRVDFMNWPRGASLMRVPEQNALHRFCTNQTRGEENRCDELASRPLGERDRHLRTPGDFAALAAGHEQVGIQSVKFVVDLSAPGLVHLIGSARWPLHYTFVRERIYQEPALDRCDPAENATFDQGWREFSAIEYYRVEGRRFLLGTLSRHAGPGLQAVEYTYGDVISGEQMRHGFFEVLPHIPEPQGWVLRPQDDNQVSKVRAVEGSLPMVGPNAPFENVTYQPLTEGIAYGTLRFVPATELEQTALGPDVIVITDDVPNDIPLVGGLITEAFQTPLAHVNVLSQNRGTPNASLKAARSELAEFLDRLVRIEVGPGGLVVTSASTDEATQFWQSRNPSGPLVAARVDLDVRGVQPLTGHGLESLPAIGAKAAQLAELGESRVPACGNRLTLVTPETPFAIPLAHSLEHYRASGALELLDSLARDNDFIANPVARAEGLSSVRQKILEHPVEPALLAEVEAAVMARFGSERVRFRSSSNTEDLPAFNGAGLYTSTSAELGDPERNVADAMRTVWASLYNARAYDERRYGHIDDDSVAMGILVHGAFLGERANGVAISRNLLDPTRGDIYYINAQSGEASVTNPAPGVATEQLVYRWQRQPPVIYQSDSSLLGAIDPVPNQVLSSEEVVDLSCALSTIHQLFEPILNPDGENHWFAMEVEFKFLGPERALLIKQARPHSFGRPAPFNDCREL